MRRGGWGVEQKQKSESSEPATLGQADPLRAGHDEVIQDPHIDQGQSVLEPGSDGAISLGGITAPGGMVVGEDHGSGIAGQSLLYHHTGIHRRAINGAVEQGLETEHRVFVIEKDGREDLVLLLRQGYLQELGDIGGCSERVPTSQLIQQYGGSRTDNFLGLNAALYVVQALLVLYESRNIHSGLQSGIKKPAHGELRDRGEKEGLLVIEAEAVTAIQAFQVVEIGIVELGAQCSTGFTASHTTCEGTKHSASDTADS